jgi:hypothetical protein
MTSKVGRVVATETSPSFTDVDVRLDAGQRVRPGQLLYADLGEVEGKKLAILRVSTAREHNEYESPLSSQVRDAFNIESSRGREDLLRKFVVAQTQLIEILSQSSDGSYVSEEPSIIVPAGTEVQAVVSGIFDKVLGFVDKSSNAAIEVGEAIGSEGVAVTLDANAALPRHMLIAGSTGTGKSYLLGKITEQLAKLGIRHVNIDVHGEMCAATTELKGKNYVPGQTMKVKLSSLEEPEVLNMIPAYNQLHVDIITKAFINMKNSHKPFTVQDLSDEAAGVAGQYGAKKSTIDIVTSRIEALNGVLFLGSGFEWTSELAPRGALINLDCRELGHFALRTVVGAVARELMSLRKKGEIGPIVLSMDEAHLFLPAGDVSPSSQVLAELIRFGRHHGVGIIISSQSPGDIDRRITKITNTRFIFAIEPSELSSIIGLLGDTPNELMQNLPRLRVGTCLLAGSRETVKHSLVIQVSKRQTKHGGETPKMTDK